MEFMIRISGKGGGAELPYQIVHALVPSWKSGRDWMGLAIDVDAPDFEERVIEFGRARIRVFTVNPSGVQGVWANVRVEQISEG